VSYAHHTGEGRQLSIPKQRIRLTGMKIVVNAGACVVLVGAGLCATAAPASACPNGTVPSDYAGVCVSGTSGGGQAVAPSPPQAGAVYGGGPNELPTVDGIPCTPQHLGTCIGLSMSQG
jgi:hypothetical protein